MSPLSPHGVGPWMETWVGPWDPGLGGGNVLLGLLAALLLGIRHASDPDHVTALSTLVFSDRADARRRAGRLGLAWGLGHAATLFLFGLPAVLVVGASLLLVQAFFAPARTRDEADSEFRHEGAAVAIGQQ